MKNFRVWILFFLFSSLHLHWSGSYLQRGSDEVICRLSEFRFLRVQRNLKNVLPLNLTALNRITRNEIDPVFHCGPKTTSINMVDQNGVYRWVDEQGNTHFSDKPPTGVSSENLTGKYTERHQFLPSRLSIEVEVYPSICRPDCLWIPDRFSVSCHIS